MSDGSDIRAKPPARTAEPASGNILEVARARRGTLRKSDRKVCDLVLADPRRILTATVAETADLAEVSQPTVIRFCTAIGCEGFQDFKLRLAKALALGLPATHTAIADTDGPSAVADKIFDYMMTSLDWARHHLDRQALDDAVRCLTAARRIEFFGFGASGIVARDAQQKFPLFGVPCGAEIDSHQQVMVVSMLGPGDVAVMISNTAATRSTVEIARIARARGARVIGLVGMRGPLTEQCDIVLLAETLENTEVYTPTISRIAALTVIDILSTSVALARGQTHMEDIMQMKRTLSAFRAGTPG